MQKYSHVIDSQTGEADMKPNSYTCHGRETEALRGQRVTWRIEETSTEEVTFQPGLKRLVLHQGIWDSLFKGIGVGKNAV